MLFDLIHKLFNPHCLHCKEELQRKHEMDLEIEREVRTCKSCEILKFELEKTQARERLLLSRLMESPKTEEVPQQNYGQGSSVPVIVPRSTTWRSQQARLEAESAEQARKIQEERLKELEKSTGVADATQ